MNRLRSWLKILPVVGLVAFALVALIRLQLADTNVRRELASLKTASTMGIGQTSHLEILPLYEGAASQTGLQNGLGVSYLVKTDTATILFDVGNNPEDVSPSPLEQNMARLGVGLEQVDIVVISHTHFDHTGGKRWQSQGTFSIAGNTRIPLGDRPIYLPEKLTYPGSHPVIADAPIKIAEGVAVTGGIPFVYPFPAWLAVPQGIEESLAVQVKGVGIVLVTGCGHMGLESLVAHAQAQFGTPIAGIVGGLHEGDADVQDLQREVHLLEQLSLHVLAVSPHDSRSSALHAFEQSFPSAYQAVEVGQSILIP